MQTQKEIIGLWTSNLCLGKPEDYPGGKAPITGTVVEPSACLTGVGHSKTYLGTLSAHIEDISGMTLPSIKNLFPGTNWYGLTLTSTGVAYMIPEAQGCLGTDKPSYTSNGYLGCRRILN